MNRVELLRKISALDFYIIDLGLYLNTHPCDKEAIALYNEHVEQANKLKKEYTELYGMLLSNNSASKCPWQWIENPWPWQKAFNFELRGDMD